MPTTLIVNAKIINEGIIEEKNLFLKNGLIVKIGENISHLDSDNIFDLQRNYIMPWIIDDQVHFIEPSLTHKATIYSESKAAVAGGVTSFMEMPNIIPNALTIKLLEKKYEIVRLNSCANYSFFIGGSNNNYEEVM